MACYVFIVAVLYNVARALLLWKTKRLEHEQEVRGFVPRFRLEGRWWPSVYWTATRLFYAYPVFVRYNTWHFLMKSVPIGH